MWQATAVKVDLALTMNFAKQNLIGGVEIMVWKIAETASSVL
jgi:hypothetical protein